MTQEDFKKNIEGAVNDFVDGIATRGQLFSAIMNTILQMEKQRPPTIKVRIERQDNLEGFAAYLTPSLTQDGTAIVLMNVEATFHAAAANNESPVDFMIENVMHEVGHALQEFFGKEFSEEQVEGIVEKYRKIYGVPEPTDRTLDTLQDHIASWQEKTFPGGTAEAQFNHLLEEIHNELGKDLSNAEEIADCVILLIGIASKAGVNLRKAIEKKMVINRRRTWGPQDEKGIIRHTAEGEQ